MLFPCFRRCVRFFFASSLLLLSSLVSAAINKRVFSLSRICLLVVVVVELEVLVPCAFLFQMLPANGIFARFTVTSAHLTMLIMLLFEQVSVCVGDRVRMIRMAQ